MTQPSKQRIRDSFAGAAHSYDSAAQIQRRICGRLAMGLSETTPGVILDAGCGTGYALRLLHERYQQAHLIGLDLAPAMLAKVRSHIFRLAGDVEHLPLANGSVGLYWSSLTLQWCHLPVALAEARRVLRDGGRLAVATLGPETFKELRTAFSAGDAYRHTLDFLDAEAVVAAAASFADVRSERAPQIAYYPDLKSLLCAIKAIGANQVGSGRRSGLMSRATWTRIEAAYEVMRQPAGLPLTYDVITLHARK